MIKLIRYFLLLLLLVLLLASLWDSTPKPISTSNELGDFTLPKGFKISLFASGVPGARSLALGERGTIFVGSRGERSIYAIIPHLDYSRAKQVITLSDQLDSPNGVAFRDGNLYVGEIHQVLRYDDIEENLDNLPQPTVVTDAYPKERHHGWKFIRFSPDGLLYIPVGAPCNICEKEEPIFSTITRIDPNNPKPEIFAYGVRNSVGFDWHPKTKTLWFTDNGRDWLGDDYPPDELNHAGKPGLHFGYPYCHGGTIPDPEFGALKPCAETTPPAQALPAHVAPLGVRFYTGRMFPSEYKHQLFIAEHGSWNRSSPVGYRISLATISDDKVTSYKPFIEGWLKNGNVRGRPVDLLNLPDGSLLISDDHAGVVYRVSYAG